MKKILLIFLSLLLDISLNAQQIYPVTTGANFLTIPISGKYAAMAETGVAISSGDENDLSVNVAKLTKVTSDYNISANYIRWGSGSGMVGDICFATKTYSKNTFAVNVRYFSTGTTVYKDTYGGILGSFKPNEYALSFAYAIPLSEHISIGASLKGISSSMYNTNLAEYSNYKKAYALAGDVGIYYQAFTEDSYNPVGISLGATIQNIGNKMKYNNTTEDYLPTNLKLGASLNLVIDDLSSINIGIDLNKLLVPSQGPQYSSSKNVVTGMLSSFGDAPGGFAEEIKEIRWSVGCEYAYKTAFYARAGYTKEAFEKGNRTYVSAGGGLRYSIHDIPTKIDVAYFVPTSKNSPYLNNFAITVGVGVFRQENRAYKRKKKEQQRPTKTESKQLNSKISSYKQEQQD